MYSPTPDEFLNLAARGNLIPVTRRILADIETPLSAYRKIRGQGESFLFESVEGGEHLGRTHSSAAIRAPSSDKPATASKSLRTKKSSKVLSLLVGQASSLSLN